MAEVMSKTHIFSCSDIHHHRHRHQHGVSILPMKSAIFSRAMGVPSLKLRSDDLRSSNGSNFFGRRFFDGGRVGTPMPITSRGKENIPSAQMSIGIGKAQKWWEKGLQPNMREVEGAQDLVDSLLSAGDKLVIVDFFSPGCGGCKALHPKLCQLAEANPDVQFLQVNYEEHKAMCYALNVHVLPFFRFYRGAQGRVCSFSCTNATIKKFRDALTKHGPDRCSLGPTKGLEEKELIALAENRELGFEYSPKKEKEPVPVPVPAHWNVVLPVLPLPVPLSTAADLVSSGR